MEITSEQYGKIEGYFPTREATVKNGNLQVLNAILYVGEHGCKWRGLPKRFGILAHDLYPHERWRRREFWIASSRLYSVRTSSKFESKQYHWTARWWKYTLMHRRSKKNGPQAIGKSRGGWTTKIHMVAAGPRTAVNFLLSPGNVHDAAPDESYWKPLICKPISLSWTAHTRVTKLVSWSGSCYDTGGAA